MDKYDETIKKIDEIPDKVHLQLIKANRNLNKPFICYSILMMSILLLLLIWL